MATSDSVVDLFPRCEVPNLVQLMAPKGMEQFSVTAGPMAVMATPKRVGDGSNHELDTVILQPTNKWPVPHKLTRPQVARLALNGMNPTI